MSNVNLKDALPEHVQAGFEFRRIELLDEEGFPLGLVWYKDPKDPKPESGARIDLHKQCFLDDFGSVDRLTLKPAAEQIVLLLNRLARPPALQESQP